MEAVSYHENNCRAFKEDLRSSSSKWKSHQIYTICTLIQAGLSTDEICKIMNIPIENKKERQQFRKLLYHLKHKYTWSLITKEYDFSNCDKSNKHYTVISEKDELIITRLNQYYNLSAYEISNILDINHTTITKFLKKKGLPTSFDRKRRFIYKDERINA